MNTGMAPDCGLKPFDQVWADEVRGWVVNSDECLNWASLPHLPDNPSIFAIWHCDPDIRPFVLLQDATAIGYGEIWIDADADEVELARILVKPACRGCGVGRRLVGLLLAEAAKSRLPNAFVRVYPENAAAIACYQPAGFRRVDADIEASWNQSQPAAYAWLQRSLPLK
jgi:ribosomal protein S18 acetylase RimI-like enzyme